MCIQELVDVTGPLLVEGRYVNVRYPGIAPGRLFLRPAGDFDSPKTGFGATMFETRGKAPGLVPARYFFASQAAYLALGIT